ncbi:MAG TPA: hypothetical protein VGQ82_11170 [Chthoniobacterales bacterium]|nr:hypothetical protein [Chthoniobacterales bacterium]
MSGNAYQTAPIFLIRMAGVPFEYLERLATPDTALAARDLLVRHGEFAQAKSAVEALLQSDRHGLSEELFRAWRKAIRSDTMPPVADPASSAFATCWHCASNLAAAESRLKLALQRELSVARRALFVAAGTALPPYLIFTAEALRERLAKQSAAAANALPPRNKQARAHERHLLLYVQRICAKNDSLSEFGPEGWGRVDRNVTALELAPRTGIAERETFLERWTAHGAAAALNADPEIRAELSPRVHPNGRVEGLRFVFTETGETSPLDEQAVSLLARCDGQTPAHSLGQNKLLEQLAEQNIIRWEVEVPALEPHAFDVLMAEIAGWRETPARARWIELLEPIAALPKKFAKTHDTVSRIEIIDEARARLETLGAARKTSDRFLYSAVNPIGEECFRDCGFSISDDLISEVTLNAAPWIDLWRDCYAFIASRVAAGLRGLLEKAPLQNGAVSLPAFLRHCEMLKMPLTGPALVALAHIAFEEVKVAFRARLRDRPEADEWELTADDCRFVRQTFEYPKFDEYTYPSADLQIAAASVEAVAQGRYQWVLAELHPPIALLHHGFYWSCPDKAALARALVSTAQGHPSFHFGFFAADFTATTTVRQLDAMPDLASFVAPQRGNPRWRTIPPAEIEVYADQATGDVRLRKRGSEEYLGSFARAWVIPLGFHPFQLGRSPHMPRLRCGKVIVQRQSWSVSADELMAGDFTGISRHLVLAIEKLRGEKGWPRFVYIRPTEQALRRSGAEGRDKDTKPVFIDLESYLFLEIFHRWLMKAGELEVTEMLPAPHDLLWREADGRRTFELRTLIVPNR